MSRSLRTRFSLPVVMAALSLAVALVAPVRATSQEMAKIEVGTIPPIPEITHHPEPAGVQVDTFATGFQVVWGMEFAPDGRLFVAEREGRVRLIPAGEKFDREQTWLSMEDRVYYSGESGLMGIALHPDFATQPYLYVMYSVKGEAGAPFDRVSRFRADGAEPGDEEILLDEIPTREARSNNRGGSIEFGPDGMLYIAVGEQFKEELAADPQDLHGTILRITPDGDIPADNPSPDSPIWAYGLRNVHGMAWDPQTGQMFAADHGPSGEAELYGYDRLLAIEKGGNHGWPAFVGASGREDLVDPIIVFERPIPPGDLIFHEGDLYMAALGFSPVGGHALLRIQLENAGGQFRPTAIERWFNDEEGNSVFGRIRTLAIGPDGALYIATSNTDERSLRRDRTDHIFRVAIQ